MPRHLLSPWFLAQLLACALCASVVVQLWRRRAEAGVPALLALVVATGVQVAGSAYASAAGREETAVAVARFIRAPGSLAALAWLGFALLYTGVGRSAKATRWLGALGAFAAAMVLLATLAGGDLLVAGAALAGGGDGRSGFVPVPGPAHGLQVGFATGAVAVATGILALHLAQAPGHLLQLALVLGAPALVAAAALFPVVAPGMMPPWVDPTPLALAAAVAALAHGFADGRDVGMEPVARSAVVEEMEDAVLVLGRDGRIVDLNRTARDRLGLAVRGPLPVEIGSLWAASWETLRRDGIALTTRVELRLAGGRAVPFDMSMTPLGPRAGQGRTVLVLRDITERERMERELRHATESLRFLANTDGLTGLDNRRRFQERLREEVERAHRYERPLALVLLDLDHFKKVNDTWGHPAGDRVLQGTSAALRRVLRDMDVAGRMGGEEFAVLLPETDLSGARALAERLRVEVGRVDHASDDGEAFRVTASLGVTSLDPGAWHDAEVLLKAADEALYQAKNRGRDRVAWRSPEQVADRTA